MLDLNTIFGMREQMLPQEGLIGFLLNHWLVIAIVVMVLGFVLDQVLYVVRYRPQDRWMHVYRRIRNLVLKWMGKDVPAEAEEEPVQEEEPPQPAEPQVMAKAAADLDAPVIRRGGARYAPNPPRKVEAEVEASQTEADEDAPLIVRAPAPRRNQDPDTQRRGTQQ